MSERKCEKCKEVKSEQDLHRVTGYGVICEDCMIEIENKVLNHKTNPFKTRREG